MNTPLFHVALPAALTGLLWLPYGVGRLRLRGLAATLGCPGRRAPPSPWAARLQRAHANAVGNLAVSATPVLVAEASGRADAAVGTDAIAYFRARVVHALAHSLAVPGVRTLAFRAGFAALAAVAG